MSGPSRRADLVVRELPGELVVYDPSSHRAHCLNDTAARVFRAADGSRGLDALAAVLAPLVPADERAAIAALALEQLSAAGLLEPALAAPAAPSRRALLRGAATAAALLPAVLSVLAPTPAEAASCGPTCSASTYGLSCPCADGTCGECSASAGACVYPAGTVTCE